MTPGLPIRPRRRLVAWAGAAALCALLTPLAVQAEREEHKQKHPAHSAPQRNPAPSHQRSSPQRSAPVQRPQHTQRAPAERSNAFSREQPAREQRPAPSRPQSAERPQAPQRPPPPQRETQPQQQRPQAPPQSQAQRPAQQTSPQRAPQAQEPQRGQSASPRPNAAPAHAAYSLPQGHAEMTARAQPLDAATSRSVVSQVNGARASMGGVNRAPLPNGNVTVQRGGALHIEASGNRSYGVRADGTMSSYSTPAHAATFRPNGQVASVRTSSGLRISRAPDGARFISRPLPGGAVVVSTGLHQGYVQRPVIYGNQAWVQRTYVVNGNVYSRAYHPYYYGGVVAYRYTPAYYYGPGYYRWAYTPWRRPIEYRWGWYGSPWYGYYGGYFAPAPYYPTAAFWLGDFLLAAELQESYQARLSAQAQLDAQAQQNAQAQFNAQTAPGQSSAPITPEVREAIAQEVQRQLAEEGAAAGEVSPPSPPPSAPPPPPTPFDVPPGTVTPAAPVVDGPQGAADAPAIAAPQASASATTGSAAAPAPDAETPVFLQPGRVFVVASSLDVLVDQETCSLSAGDVLRLDAPPAAGEVTASLRVLSSKGQDCAAGATATLSIDDLQEMYNNLHEKLDDGLAELKKVQGTGEVPPAPETGTVSGPGAAAPPPQDDAAAALAQTQQDADAAERELDQEMKNHAQN